MRVTELMDVPSGDEVGTPDKLIEECRCGVLFRQGEQHRCRITGGWEDTVVDQWPDERIQAELEEIERARATAGREGE